MQVGRDGADGVSGGGVGSQAGSGGGAVSGGGGDGYLSSGFDGGDYNGVVVGSDTYGDPTGTPSSVGGGGGSSTSFDSTGRTSIGGMGSLEGGSGASAAEAVEARVRARQTRLPTCLKQQTAVAVVTAVAAVGQAVAAAPTSTVSRQMKVLVLVRYQGALMADPWRSKKSCASAQARGSRRPQARARWRYWKRATLS